MRKIRNMQYAAGLLLLAFVLFISYAAFAQAPPPSEPGVQRVPYPPPNEQQVELEITFSQADPLPNSPNHIQLKHAKIKQFPKTGGEPELTAETPECIADNQLDEITSPESLKVEADHGRVFLEGIGFLLRHASSTLVVSNQVHTVLFPNVPTNAPKPKPTDIFSHHGEFEMKPEATNGVALYLGEVRVIDPKMKLWCEWLKADLPKNSPEATKDRKSVV